MANESVKWESLKGPVKITITNNETGDLIDERVVGNDYVLITVGTRYVDSIQINNGTHTLVIKRSK